MCGAIYKISSPETQDTMDKWLIFYVGVIGAIMPPLLAIGYLLVHQGLKAPEETPAAPPPPVSDIPAMPADYDDAAPTYIRDFSPSTAYETEADLTPTGPAPEDLVSAWLVDVDNSEQSYQLTKDKTELGRGQDNTYALPDETVSKRHIQVRHEGGQFILQDVGSTYGTLLNSIELEGRETLRDGDIITVGNTRLRFVDGGSL